jgi:hypothetical protein
MNCAARSPGVLAAFVLAMMFAGAAQAQAKDCSAAGFGDGKLDLDTGHEVVQVPAGVPVPIRGVVIASTGFFVNEGRSEWWILDVDAARLSHVMLLGGQRVGANDEELARYRNYDALTLPHDWTQFRRDVTLAPEALDRIACAANVVWAYETPYAVSLRKARERDAAFEAQEKARSAAYDAASRKWREEMRACRRRPECVPPPPPEPPIIEVEPVELLEPRDWYGTQFSEATDVGQSLWLLDGAQRKNIGGSGVLAGDAEALRELLRAEFAAAH